jgi:hypothetical protein
LVSSRTYALCVFVAILFLFPLFLVNVAQIPPLYSIVAGLIAATVGGIIIAARGDLRNRLTRSVPQDSPNETIAQYQNQTRQIKDMKWVLLGAIIAGTLLMMISVIAPYLIITLLHTYVTPQTNQTQTKILDTIQTLSSAPKDVLPFATALAGFAGGVVTAMFRVGTTPTTQDTSGQGPRGQSAPIADNKTVTTTVNTATTITLTGTPRTTGDVLQFTVVSPPQHGTATISDVADSHIVTYKPDANFRGSDRFTYKATDRQGVDSNIATVDITVT